MSEPIPAEFLTPGEAPLQLVGPVLKGAKGDKGDKGDTGNTGAGVPAGGTAGQLLAKASSADRDTGWIAAPTVASIGAAPAAQGVTGGNSHDHNGGDGAQIAYTSLSGLPPLGNSSGLNVGTTAGTVAAGNDSRLSDSREWTAATIAQAEAEAGIATTRRAFTAERVRQAIVAWWNGSSPAATIADLGTAALLDAGAAGGVAPLDGSGKVAAAYLPGFVDDVIEAANLAALPGTGESGKIYVALDNGKTYRWSGSAYVEISASPGSTDAVPEGATNLYFTTARAIAQVTWGNLAGIPAWISGSVAYGQSLLAAANAAAARTLLGLGGASTLNVGTTTGTVAAGDDGRVVNAMQSAIAGITGADRVSNIVSLTRLEYLALSTPRNASTFYVITRTDPLYETAGQVPAFDLRFFNGSIVDAISGITPTYTRPSSVHTVWTGAGFTDFAADVPAFAVDPATVRTGYVHNPAATNGLIRSGGFGSTGWVLGTNTSLEVGVQSLEVLSGNRVTRLTNAGNNATSQGTTSIAAGVVTAWVIASGTHEIGIRMQNVFPDRADGLFNLATGVARGATTTGTPSAASANMRSLGNGVYICSLTATMAASNPVLFIGPADSLLPLSTWPNASAVLSSVTVYHAQIETEPVGTSPIITAGSVVTRAADTMTFSGVSFNGGTLYVEAFRTGNGTRPLMSFNDGTANERIELITSGTDPVLNVVDGGASQASVDGGTFAANSIIKVAAVVGANNFAVSVNGGAPVVDSSGTMPTVDRLFIGTDQAGNRSVGPIYRAMWFPPGAAQSNIQQLTV